MGVMGRGKAARQGHLNKGAKAQRTGRRAWGLVIVAPLFALGALTSIAVSEKPPAALAQNCSQATGSAGAYTLVTCITVPSSGATVSGVQSVVATAKITQTGSSVRMNNIAFCLGVDDCDAQPTPDNYVMTSYQPTISADGTRTYTFDLDTSLWPDGQHRLFALPVTNLDTLTAASVDLTFANGVISRPPLPTGFEPRQGNAPPAGEPFTFAAVGDGAGGLRAQSRVSAMIARWAPNMFLYLGDVYQKGSPAEFTNNYDRGGYGQFEAITNPAIGNHEYSADAAADGYFRYWDSPPDYYSFDAGGWHLIVLNSTEQFNGDPGPTAQDSKDNPDPNSQYNWLKADLESNADKCTIVTYHHPVFNTGHQSKVGFDPTARNESYFQDMWELMADHSVSLVLNGHDHNYQRFIPIGRDGRASPTGITQIIAGGGGHAVSTPAKYNMETDGPMLAASGTFYGAARLTAHPDRMDFYVGNADSGEMFEQGSVPCQALGPDLVPPVVPTSVTATAMVQGSGHPQIQLAWTLSATPDDRGVAQIYVRRSGTPGVIAKVSSAGQSWTDTSVQLGSAYSYTITAVDAWGNESAPITSAVVSAPAVPTTNSAVADTYVNSGSSNSTYGTANPIRVSRSTTSVMRSLLKFDLTREQPNITSATLRILPSSSAANTTITVRGVNSTSWNEARNGTGSVTWMTQPSLGAVGPSVRGFTAGSWVEYDVTSLVTSNTLVSLALVQEIAGTAVAINSREGGAAVAAQLVVTSAPPLDSTSPSVPVGVTATAPTDAESPVTVTWLASTDNAGAVDHYVVLRNGTAIATETDLVHVDATVAAGVTFEYSVIAVDRVGNASNASSVTAASTATTLDITPPEAPESASVIAVSSTSARVSWEKGLDNVAVAGYQVVRRAGTTGSFTVIAEGSASTLQFTDFGLQPGSNYSYDLRTVDTSGNRSEQFRAGVITTAGSSEDTSPPTTPPNFTASATNSTVSLTWDPATDNVGVSNYPLLRGVTLVQPGPQGTEMQYTETGLQPGTTYEFSLFAQDAAGNVSDVPATLLVTTLDDVPPSAPTGLAVALGPNVANLTWAAATDNVGVASYRIYDGATQVGTSASTSAQLATQPGTSYQFSVTAVDAAGNVSAASGASSVTTESYVGRAATLTDDSYVKNGTSAGSNYGNATLMRVQGGTTVQKAYVRFTVDGNQLRAVLQRSVLQLYAQGSQPSVTVSLVDNNAWTERTITFNNAPVAGAVLGTVPLTTIEGWLELDVTAWVRAPGTYSFVITTTSTLVPKFSTKEWSPADPQLPAQTPRLLITSHG